MQIEEFLKDKRFHLPQRLKGSDTKEGSVHEHLKTRFKAYKECVYSLKVDQNDSSDFRNFSEKIEGQMERVLYSIKYALDGDLIEAANNITDLLNGTNDDRPSIEKALPIIELNDKNVFYRARGSQTPLKESYELFHVPFEERHKVKEQRFSLPGLPCLYLGQSLHGCWLELSKPELNNFYFARFVPENGYGRNILDLCCDFRGSYTEECKTALKGGASVDILSNKRHPAKKFLTNMYWWPLMAACSLVRPTRENSFNQEFIIPHLLMMHLKRHNSSSSAVFHGFRYLSCDASIADVLPDLEDNDLYKNIAIPIYKSEKNGYCTELRKAFKDSPCLSWRELESSDINIREDDGPNNKDKTMINCERRERKETYAESRFYRMEMASITEQPSSDHMNSLVTNEANAPVK